MTTDEIEKRIVEALGEAYVRVRDMTGGGDHFEVLVVSPAFAGRSLVERHRMVHDALADALGGAIHALSLQTRTPEEMPRGPGREAHP